MDFRTDVTLGLKKPLSVPLMNGGGCCKTVEDVLTLARSPITGAIVAGSFTVEERTGNPGSVWEYRNGVGLNSLGMPNGGRKYLEKNLKDMVGIAHDAEKALVVNVAGFNPEEYVDLSSIAALLGADAIELNLGCPNVIKGGDERKPIASFNYQVVEQILFGVGWAIKEQIPVWVKFSPFSDPSLLAEIAKIVCRFSYVKAVTVINTFPSAYGLDDKGDSLITVGLAGLSGTPLKHIGLGQVLQWDHQLGGCGRKDISIIAVGGIGSGKDIKDYISAGADAFQMTTEILRSNKIDADAFGRVATQFEFL